MKEGKRAEVIDEESAAEITNVDGMGNEGITPRLQLGLSPIGTDNTSRILEYVESLHLMKRHPFHDIVHLLRMVSLSWDPSSLEQMEWVQCQVLTPIEEEILYIKEMEVARRSLVVSSLLPPISRLERNEWSKCHERGEELSLLERQRREFVFELLMNIATQVAMMIRSISYHSTSSDGFVHPTDAYSVNAIRNQLALLFSTQQSMNEKAYQAILCSHPKAERLLLFHLDSVLSYDRVSLQLLVVSKLFLPALSISSLQESLRALRLSFPERTVLSAPLPARDSSHAESIYQPLLDCLRTAFLGLQTLDDGRGEDEHEQQLRNYKAAINSAFDALLSKKTERLGVNAQAEQPSVDLQEPTLVADVGRPMEREEDGVMYIYQGVSREGERPRRLQSETSVSFRNRQIQSDLVREVAILQQRRMQSIPVKVIGELPSTEEPKAEDICSSPSLPNLFSYLSKPEVELDRIES